jgi:glycosyltransferase involved in cell wall biosynthesis
MLVSAIMPVFNAERTIADAVVSVVMQSYEDWELIILDDGSKDNTFRVASSLGSIDDRIRVVRQSRAGRGSARNRCIEESRGSLIVICDGDDLSFPERFAVHVGHCTGQADVGISCSARNIVFSESMDSGQMYYQDFPSRASEIRTALERRKSSINHPGSAIARSLFDTVGKYDSRLRRCQDYGFFRRAAEHAKIECVTTPLILYRATSRFTSWEYFWSSKRYQWYADQLHRGRSYMEALDEDSLDEPTPGIVYRCKVALQFIVHRLRVNSAQRRGLSESDRLRAEEFMHRLTSFRDQLPHPRDGSASPFLR